MRPGCGFPAFRSMSQQDESTCRIWPMQGLRRSWWVSTPCPPRAAYGRTSSSEDEATLAWRPTIRRQAGLRSESPGMADRVIDSTAAEVAPPSPRPEEWTDLTSLRSHLSSLQGLMVLAMLMNESDDEARILLLAATTVPRISRSRFQGALLTASGWQFS